MYPPVTITPRQKDAWRYGRADGKYHKYRIETINGQWWYRLYEAGSYAKRGTGDEMPDNCDSSKSVAVSLDHYYVSDGKHIYYLDIDNTVNVDKTFTKYACQWR